MSETPVEEIPEEHEIDDDGNDIHVDVDEQIPTGIYKICLKQKEAEATPEPEVDESEQDESEPE